jgi:RNA polymerase subunit RPABC4/transcription elongation factor Spt4
MSRWKSKSLLTFVAKIVLLLVLIMIAIPVVRHTIGLSMTLLPLVFIVSWVVIPIWVAGDARQRGAESPLLWAVFVLLTWIVGLVIYLLLRPRETVTFECDSCGRQVKSEYTACPHCGNDLRPRIGRCPSCKRLVDRDWAFCPYCKTELRS